MSVVSPASAVTSNPSERTTATSALTTGSGKSLTRLSGVPTGKVVLAKDQTKKLRIQVSGGKRVVVVQKKRTKSQSKKWRKVTIRRSDKTGRVIVSITGESRAAKHPRLGQGNQEGRLGKKPSFQGAPPHGRVGVCCRDH